jgi:hypothetical protein
MYIKEVDGDQLVLVKEDDSRYESFSKTGHQILEQFTEKKSMNLHKYQEKA